MKQKIPPHRRALYRKRGEKSGLPPGSLVYLGDRKDAAVRMTLMDYDESSHTEQAIAAPLECEPFRDAQSITWINVDGLSHPAPLEELGRVMRFHSLVMEDVLNTDQRPKCEDYGDYLFVVAKMLEIDAGSTQVRPEHLCLILGKNYVVSLQEVPGDPFEPVRARIRSGAGRIRKSGADYLLYALLDVAVDQYFVVLDRLGDRIEQLDHLIMTTQSPRIMGEMHALKREILFLRKNVLPLREVVSTLRHSESELIADATYPFLRDLHDHVVQVGDRIETYRDLLAGMLDLYLSNVSNRTNTVMKIIAVFSSVFLPLTFITGLFGMNFDFMPLLHSPSGFGIVLVSMVVVVIAMLAVFRWRRLI